MNGGKLLLSFLKHCRAVLAEIFFRKDLSTTDLKGKFGENLAKNFLSKKGYSLLEKNWRCKKNRRLEIDLIFKDGEILVFVEVRARSSKSLVSGYDSINRKKLNILKRAFNSYLRANSKQSPHYRFDIVEIDLPSEKYLKPSIYHHENIAIF
jgi:putative endonuclease